MKNRTLAEIINNGPQDTGDISTKEALITAYSAVEQLSAQIPNANSTLAVLRAILQSMN